MTNLYQFGQVYTILNQFRTIWTKNVYGLPLETCASACELSRQQQAVCTVQQMFKTTKEQISLSSYLSLIVE